MLSSHYEVMDFIVDNVVRLAGKVTSGYRIRDGQWTEIGRQSPQKPQVMGDIGIWCTLPPFHSHEDCTTPFKGIHACKCSCTSEH